MMMKAGYTKITLAVLFTWIGACAVFRGDWYIGVIVLTNLFAVATLAYQAGRGDDAWK